MCLPVSYQCSLDQIESMGAQSDVSVHKNEINSSENSPVEVKHLEDAAVQDGNLVYDGDEEPEIHMRTWIALAAMFLLNYVQVIALQGPPAVVGRTELDTVHSLIVCSSRTSARASMVPKRRLGCLTLYHLFKQLCLP